MLSYSCCIHCLAYINHLMFYKNTLTKIAFKGEQPVSSKNVMKSSLCIYVSQHYQIFPKTLEKRTRKPEQGLDNYITEKAIVEPCCHATELVSILFSMAPWEEAFSLAKKSPAHFYRANFPVSKSPRCKWKHSKDFFTLILADFLDGVLEYLIGFK